MSIIQEVGVSISSNAALETCLRGLGVERGSPDP